MRTPCTRQTLFLAMMVLVGSSIWVVGAVFDPWPAGTGESVPCGPHDPLVAGCVLWSGLSDDDGHFDDFVALALHPDGHQLFAAGRSDTPVFASWGTLAAFDATTGDRMWKVKVATPLQGPISEPADVAVAPDGARTYYAIGFADGWGRAHGLAAHDPATGDLLWTAAIPAPGLHGTALPSSVLPSPDGTTVFLMSRERDGGNPHAVAFAFDGTTGAERWRTKLPSAWNPVHGAVSSDGATAYVAATDRRGDLLVAALDGTNGGVAWSTSIDGPSGLDDVASGVALSPDGTRLHVAGHVIGPHGPHALLIVSVDTASGTVAWARELAVGAAQPSPAISVATSSGGSLVHLGGAVTGDDGRSDVLIVALNATMGTPTWEWSFGTDGSEDVLRALVAAPDGKGLVVTGSTFRPLPPETGVTWGPATPFTTLLDAASGEPLWSARHDGSRYDGGGRVASFSAEGEVVYVGATVVPDPVCTDDCLDIAVVALHAREAAIDAVTKVPAP